MRYVTIDNIWVWIYTYKVSNIMVGSLSMSVNKWNFGGKLYWKGSDMEFVLLYPVLDVIKKLWYVRQLCSNQKSRV